MDKNSTSAKDQLLLNKEYFDSCVQIAKQLFKDDLIDDCINYIEKISSFAWHNFSGIYKSEILEGLLCKIQEKLLVPFERQNKTEDNPNGKILHICSEIHTAGGHSKLLYNWIKLDKNREHTILCTRFSTERIIAISKNYTTDFSNLKHQSVIADTKINSVRLLNELITDDYDLIVLHIHPDEVITNIVLSQASITIPVCFVNHADHTFWLGTYISDLILQIRKNNILLDVERRGIPVERQVFLPIPIDIKLREKEKYETKILYLLSTGTAFKYQPKEGYNFLEEAYRIVEENHQVIFNIVGIDGDSEYAKKHQHDRINFHGQITSTKLKEIEEITDIYVEGFPTPSFTALLQVAMMKIPFILHYKPLPVFRLFDDCEAEAIIYPENIQDWRGMIQKLISDEKYRLEVTEKQHSNILYSYSKENWMHRLENIYNKTDKLTHSFLKPSKDYYFYNENEEILVTIDNKKFPHFRYTENLSIKGKLYVYLKSMKRNKNITYFGTKNLLKYFFSKYRD